MKPILFSTEMVQAILDDRKTQTRRVIKTVPRIASDVENLVRLFQTKFLLPHFEVLPIKLGDILWVREMFTETDAGSYIYKASFPEHSVKWRPSIHMPLNAARIFLEVTDVRVERLQDISEEDAIAEGLKYLYNDETGYIPSKTAKNYFQILWQKINGEKHPWKSNPWVWVYEFKLIEKPNNLK